MKTALIKQATSKCLTLCMLLVIVHALVFVSCLLFKVNFIKKKSSMNTVCQMIWFKSRTDVLPVVGPDLGSNCLQRLSVDDYSRR